MELGVSKSSIHFETNSRQVRESKTVFFINGPFKKLCKNNKENMWRKWEWVWIFFWIIVDIIIIFWSF